MLFRFWVFPDCTFLDISTLHHLKQTKMFLSFWGMKSVLL